MIRYARRHPLLALALAVLVVGVLIAARPAAAHEEDVVGWTVEQGGRSHHYPLKDRWTITFNANGVTLEHGGEHVTHHYYGTFRVIDRRK